MEKPGMTGTKNAAVNTGNDKLLKKQDEDRKLREQEELERKMQQSRIGAAMVILFS